MNDTIRALANELHEEAEAIRKYTEDIAFVGEQDPEVTALLKDIRLDELEHVQKLAIALSKALVEAEPGDKTGGEQE